MICFPPFCGGILLDRNFQTVYTYFYMDKKRKIITIAIIVSIILAVGTALTITLLRLFNNEQSHLVVSEWEVEFEIPDTITDVHYKIIDDTAYFVAKPKGAKVEFPADLDDKFAEYSMNWIERSPDKFVAHEGYIYWREKLGFYFVIGGSGNTGIFGDADTSGEYQAAVSKALEEMFESFQPEQH